MDVLLGLAAGLVSSVPMLGPVVMLLIWGGTRGEVRSARALALGAALAEGVHVALAAFGIGPWLLAQPNLTKPLGIVSGALLVAIAVLAWRARDGGATKKSLPQSSAGAFGLGLILVLPNPGFLIVWVAIVGWLGARGITSLGPGFVAGATIGIVGWFTIVMALATRIGPRASPTTLRRMRLTIALVLCIFGLWSIVQTLSR